MPFIDPDHGYLTVLNLFRTDTPERMDRLVHEMRAIVDTAAFPGWISSTVHRGEEKLGTANFIQWRGQQDLQARYAGDEFKHRTVPVFREITTYVRLMQTEVVASRRHPALDDVTEISPDRDDYTVIEVLDVDPADQSALVAAVDTAHEWLVDVPGYRSQTVLRGIRSRATADSETGLETIGTDHDFVVIYSQWAGEESYQAFRATPQDDRSPARRASQQQRAALSKAVERNTYRAVHTRSAEQSVA